MDKAILRRHRTYSLFIAGSVIIMAGLYVGFLWVPPQAGQVYTVMKLANLCRAVAVACG